MDPVSLSGALRSAAQAGAGAQPASKASFGDEIRAALEAANRDQVEAEKAGQGLARGEADIVDTMVALGKADLSLRFVVALRNKALEAYNEIMRLQV